MTAFVLALVTFMSLCGCAALSADKVYHGRYAYNWEYAFFMPDGTDERWCTVGNMSKAEIWVPAVGKSKYSKLSKLTHICHTETRPCRMIARVAAACGILP